MYLYIWSMEIPCILALSKAPRNHWPLNEKLGTRPGMHSYKLFIRGAAESPKTIKGIAIAPGCTLPQYLMNKL